MIINVNPDVMHILFFNSLGLLYLFSFLGLEVLCNLRLLRIEIYFCYYY